jgi:peptidoglycan/xylan/chitin deacetylase (PgdA/CDA1 family)
MKRKFLVFLCIVVLIVLLGINWARRHYVVPILMYHHISENNGGLNVSPQNFKKQMEFLHRGGYKVISLKELSHGIKADRGFNFKTVVITFDDGYRDNFVYAYPILKKYGFPATIFLVSSYVGQDDFLTWDQIRQMKDDGISFGAHTRTHKYLPSLKGKPLIEEVVNCKRQIEANLGERVEFFSYPTGGFNDEVKDVLRDAGFTAACTINRGRDRFNRDLFELKRIKVKNSAANPVDFFFKLSGFYNLFRSAKEGD